MFIDNNNQIEKWRKKITIEIEYERLFFDDMIYIMQSLKETTREFFIRNKYWYDKNIYNFLIENENIRRYFEEEEIRRNKKEYFDEKYPFIIDDLKVIMENSITYEIFELSKGSMRIHCAFVIAENTFVPLSFLDHFTTGVIIGTLIGIAHIIYTGHEKEFDNKLKQLQKEWNYERRRGTRKRRGIRFKLYQK